MGASGANWSPVSSSSDCSATECGRENDGRSGLGVAAAAGAAAASPAMREGCGCCAWSQCREEIARWRRGRMRGRTTRRCPASLEDIGYPAGSRTGAPMSDVAPQPEAQRPVVYTRSWRTPVDLPGRGCRLPPRGLVTCLNVYFGLKTGWSLGGSLIAAILGFGVFRILPTRRDFTRLETNIARTAGSAAGSMTRRPASSRPSLRWGCSAMSSTGGGDALGLAVAYLGVFFAVPLRRQMVLQEKPVSDRHGHGGDRHGHVLRGQRCRRRGRLLLWAGVAAGSPVGPLLPEGRAPGGRRRSLCRGGGLGLQPAHQCGD